MHTPKVLLKPISTEAPLPSQQSTAESALWM